MNTPIDQSAEQTNTQVQLSEPGNTTPQPVDPSRRRKKLIALALVLIVGISIGTIGYYLVTPRADSIKKSAQKIITQVKSKAEPSAVPTPMPFRDMTVPFLREQTYKSGLAELVPAYEGVNYSAYTTSYTSDGLKINGLLTRPKGEAPEGGWPAIVFIHGYIPPTVYDTLGQAYSSYIDYLAGNGFVVFKIDLRGHGQSEGEPGGAYYSSDYVIDALNAYAALENTDFVNPKKIGLWGHSMAGNVSMRSWAAKKEIPAVVIWAGAVYTYEDVVKYRITDSSFQPTANNAQRLRRRQQIYEEYGSPSAKVKFWQEVAPVSYLGELKGAIQLHHAADDDVVNVAYSRDLKEILSKTSIKHEYFEYPSGGHNISDINFNEAMRRTVEFYKTYLK